MVEVFMRILALLALLCSIALGGCHGHDDYDTFQACFDDHTIEEGYDAPMAITICALDHDVAGEKLDFATADECVEYVQGALAEGSATAEQITAGCQDYIVQKDK